MQSACAFACGIGDHERNGHKGGTQDRGGKTADARKQQNENGGNDQSECSLDAKKPQNKQNGTGEDRQMQTADCQTRTDTPKMLLPGV